MLATAAHRQRARRLTDKLVEKFNSKVQRFETFNDHSLGIKNFKPMEILVESTSTGKMEDVDPWLKTRVAMLMENFVQETMGNRELLETSRASLPAWVKNGLALIAAANSEDILDRVISMQPMSNRLGRIHYLDVVTERAKGGIPNRATMLDALAGFRGTEDLTSENIKGPGERLGAAGTTDYGVGTPVELGYKPVIPRSLVIRAGSQEIRDDGNGNLVGDVGAPGGGVTNTINYISGQVSVRFAAATTEAPLAEYSYNIEASLELPEFGIHLRAENVQARPRAVGASWSQQSVIDFLNDFGINAEPTIIEAGARLIQMEKFKHTVNTLRREAQGGAVIFDNTAPTGVSYRDHLKTFSLFVSRLQNLIWESTQTTRPNVMVIHPSILFIVEFQDGFEGVAFSNDGIAGPRFVGRLTKQDIDVFCDPTYPADQALLTYRGPEFVSTAAVIGDYIPLYKSPVHVRAFRKDIALLTEYVIKVIDPNMLGTITVTNL